MSTPQLDRRYLELLLEVGRGLVSSQDPEAVLERVLVAARELSGARYAALGVLDEDKRELARFLTLGVDDELRRRIGPLPKGHGILGELIRHPELLRLSRISEHPRSYGFPAEHPRMETFLGVPVMIRGEVFGNLYLTEKQDADEFDETDERLLLVLAEWAAIAIDNARAHETSLRRQAELERAMRGLEATVGLNREVIDGGHTDLARVLELVAKRGRALAEARTCAVLLFAGEGLEVAQLAGEAPQRLVGTLVPEDHSPALDVVRAGRSQRLGPTPLARLGPLAEGAAGGALVPLRSRGVDLGVFALLDPLDGARDFHPDTMLALESFAGSAATAIAATRAIEDEKARLQIASSERERQRWARELHDETLQELGALNVTQESALYGEDTDAMRAALARSSEQVEGIIRGLQGLITELRPAALDQLGTAAALEALIDRVRARGELVIEADIDLAYESGRESARPPSELEATIYRTVQEALNNADKHAGASRVRLRVEEDGNSVTIIVEDDGRGFDTEAQHDGFGLIGMRERVELAGGELEIGPGPTGGTRVTARLPMPAKRRSSPR